MRPWTPTSGCALALALGLAAPALAEGPAEAPGPLPTPREAPVEIPRLEPDPDPRATPPEDSAAPPPLPDLGTGLRQIPVEDWRALAIGRVVWYAIDGVHWGREYYFPDGQRAVFLASDGTCLSGIWWEAEGVYCFAYEGLHCFRHVEVDGRILVVSTTGGEVQTVERITEDGPLSCAPTPMM